jgi:hypothetical protein
MKIIGLFTFMTFFTAHSFAASLNCRMTEMIDFGLWSGFSKSQVQLDSKVVEAQETQLGNNLKIALGKISESKEETTLILKSSSGPEKIEIVIKPMPDSLHQFLMTLTILSARASVVSTKEIEFRSDRINVVRLAVDGSSKTVMAECDVNPNRE